LKEAATKGTRYAFSKTRDGFELRAGTTLVADITPRR